MLPALFLICSIGRMAALDPTSRLSQYGHTAWRLQDRYFGSEPWDIAQTRDGYIWVGTRDGLFRFDGAQFVRWSSQYGERLPSSFVISLLAARDGSLWIGTDAGLAHLMKEHLAVYPNGEGWAVVSILEDREGRVWIDRERSDDKVHPLCQVLNAGIRCRGKEDGLDVFNSGPILQDADGSFWVGGSTTLVKWREGESRVYRPKSLATNQGQAGIASLAAAPDGSLWVGMAMRGHGAGLQRLVNGAFKPFLAPGLKGESVGVCRLMLDQENVLWVGTYQGVYKIRGKEVDHLGTAEGLSGDIVNSFLEDREGNLWLVTSQGIDMFRDLRVKSISKREGLSAGEVQSVLASQDGRVWIGTSRLDVLETDGISSSPGKALAGHLVTSLFEDHAGRLWAGMDNTLSVFEGGRFRPITKPDGSAVGMVTGITEDSENSIWIESLGPPGALIRIDDRVVKQEFPTPEMPLARTIAADPLGGIWLGLANGDLARYRSGHLTPFILGDHPKARVQAMAALSDGSILGATAFGVTGWKSGKRQILSTRNGLPCDGVYALISDNDGNLWLYTQCGLVEIPKSEMRQWWSHPESTLNLKVFDSLDGVQPGFGNFSNSAKTPDGRLWFANANVLQVIDPSHVTGNNVPPPVYVNALVADRKSYSAGEAIRLPPLTRDLEIDYTALSYTAPQKVRFRYMLEGRDTKWQDAVTRRQAFYTNLSPRHYRFHVLACNNDGVWNDAGASIDFSVDSAYYQTSWFQAACGAVFLALLWGLYRYRVHQVAREFNLRLEERLSERTRLARDLHDTLLQSFHALMLRLQVLGDSLPPGRSKAEFEQTLERGDQAIAEGRAAVHDLRSSTTTTNELAQAIRTVANELAEESPATFCLVVVGPVRELHPIMRDELYRLSREALRNAFSHARASHIEAELTYAEHLLCLRIRDDGRGIAPAILAEGRSGRYGLPGMRERAKQIGAKFSIRSTAGAGTEIDVTIPGSIAYGPLPGRKGRT